MNNNCMDNNKEVFLMVENVKTFNKSEPISFTASSGEIVCIFGLNGSGKTVLLKSICNIFNNYSGSIEKLEDKKRVGICLQFPEHLIFKDTALSEAIQIVEDEEKAKSLLKEINADEKISPFKLSDGQKRLMFLYGYLESKDFIILDEPFVSLDDNTKEYVENKIVEASKMGKCILYTANRKSDLKIAHKIIEIKS